MGPIASHCNDRISGHVVWSGEAALNGVCDIVLLQYWPSRLVIRACLPGDREGQESRNMTACSCINMAPVTPQPSLPEGHLSQATISRIRIRACSEGGILELERNKKKKEDATAETGHGVADVVELTMTCVVSPIPRYRATWRVPESIAPPLVLDNPLLSATRCRPPAR
jgi:hypothetical protein